MESPVVAPLISIFVRKSVDDHRVTFSANTCIIHTNGFNANQQLSYAYNYYVVLWYWHVKKWSRNKYCTMASNKSIIRALGIIQIISIIRIKKLIIEEYLLMTSIHIGYFPVQLSKQVFVLWCFTIYK